MHRADIDLEHNRLILHWIDLLNVSDVERLQAEVTSLLPKLRPGFDCISDTTNMRPVSRHVAEHIERLQALLHKAGMRWVVRIVGKGDGAQRRRNPDGPHGGNGRICDHPRGASEAEALVVLSQPQPVTMSDAGSPAQTAVRADRCGPLCARPRLPRSAWRGTQRPGRRLAACRGHWRHRRPPASRTEAVRVRRQAGSAWRAWCHDRGLVRQRARSAPSRHPSAHWIDADRIRTAPRPCW